MRTAQQGDRVQVHYVKRLPDGRTASSREPLELTVGIDHPRLPGLGTALVGLTPGQATTFTVPPALAYGLPDPTRIHRWSRQRFPQGAVLRAGKLIRFTDESGRRRCLRVLEVNTKMVVVDTNHRLAGQALKLEVKLLAFLETPHCQVEASAENGGQAAPRSRAIAFDLDASSLASLRDALPGWEIVTIDGATPASLCINWNPGAADLLVVGPRANATETLGLCRLLSFCTTYSTDARTKGVQSLASSEGMQRTRPIVNATLLVLVPPGQETLVGAALEAGASSCLVLPVHAKEVMSVLAQSRAGNQPGRHTLGLDRAQEEDPWQEDGGEA